MRKHPELDFFVQLVLIILFVNSFPNWWQWAASNTNIRPSSFFFKQLQHLSKKLFTHCIIHCIKCVLVAWVCRSNFFLSFVCNKFLYLAQDTWNHPADRPECNSHMPRGRVVVSIALCNVKLLTKRSKDQNMIKHWVTGLGNLIWRLVRACLCW